MTDVVNEPNKLNCPVPGRIADIIFTQDLEYTHPEGKYSFRYTYLGEGAFFLKSIGFIDEKSFRVQLQCGHEARERLSELLPKTKFHLIWDVSLINGISLISRSMIFSRVTAIGAMASVSIIGANPFVRNFSKLFSKLIPWVRFFYFTSQKEAIENLELFFKINLKDKKSTALSTDHGRASSGFMDLWRECTEYLEIGSDKLRMVRNDNWQYVSVKHNFSVKVSLVEGNIVYYECEGYVRVSHVEKTYDILESIIDLLNFNSTYNKFYSILNIRKLKGISLSARRTLASYEKQHHDKAHLVIIIPPPVLKMFVKLAHALDYDNFSHWGAEPTVENAFERVFNHRDGHFDKLTSKKDENQDEEPAPIPKSPSGMQDMIVKLQKEIVQLKNHQQQQIDKILEITGRMTWDESFSEELLIPESSGPFSDIYASLHILFQDFKEIIREKTNHAIQLKESEDKYKNLINLATDVIGVFQEGTIKYVNSRIKQVLDIEPEEVIGKGMEGIVPLEEQVRLEEYHQKRLNGENVPWFYETVFIHRNGNHIPISMSVGAIDYENRPAVMLITRDMSQKKKTEEELERYRNHLEDILQERTKQLQKEISERKIAEESDRLKSAFLSNMSHEIRTPMNAIISFSSFLKNPEIQKEEHDEYLNYIQSSGETLLNLINDIIDISKIEAHQLQVQEAICAIDPILEELFSYFKKQLQHSVKNTVGLYLTIPERDNYLQMNTDAFRLKQILTNLLDNAIKFTDSGSIEFGYRIENEMVVFYVQDTGLGIPCDKLVHLFKRFGKIELSGRNISGTGLGLAISHNLATLLHGSLTVETIEGQGSTFYLKLPLQKINEHQLTQKPMETTYRDNYNWQDKTILIVEDEDLNFRVLQISLQSTRVRIIRAVNGKEAIEKLHEFNNIDLVLMDIQMPVMDGYEALLIVKQIHPNLPVIAQTAFAMMEEKKHCIERGFDDYISKPIKFEELFIKINRLLEIKMI